MDKETLDDQMSEIAKTIRVFCRARTSNSQDAEDLAQEIMLEVYASAGTLRDDRAFYGFMWSVARNVHKQWYRKKKRAELLCEAVHSSEYAEHETDDYEIGLLRRELSLLEKRYRQAVVLYYVERKSCAEVSKLLSISESMVKYLLFKSRQIVKEGMGMEKQFGEQSYHPRELELQFWGCGSNRYGQICENRIAKNILFACYYDKLTAEQISLEIGVALPYMEEELDMLCECGLLSREGKRYKTGIVICTKELREEIISSTHVYHERIADLIVQVLEEDEGRIRANGFGGVDMSFGAYAWQITSIMLYHAVVGHIQREHRLTFPKDGFGNTCFVWAVERERENPFALGMSNMENYRGDAVWFHDFAVNGKMAHAYYTRAEHAADILLDVARGNMGHFSEYDWASVGEMVQKGYVRMKDEKAKPNMPVYTKMQYEALLHILEEPIRRIAGEGIKVKKTVEDILGNHLPVHLRKMEKDMAYLRLFEDVISSTIRCLVQRRLLIPFSEGEMMSTAYIVLNDL